MAGVWSASTFFSIGGRSAEEDDGEEEVMMERTRGAINEFVLIVNWPHRVLSIHDHQFKFLMACLFLLTRVAIIVGWNF